MKGKGVLWFVVLEMSVHDAWPCFLLHRGEEVHCRMKRGGSSPHGSQEGKREPESAHLLGACLPETRLSLTGTHLLVLPGRPTAPQTSSSLNGPLGLIHPNHNGYGSYIWGHQASRAEFLSLCRLLCKQSDSTFSRDSDRVGFAFNLWSLFQGRTLEIGQLCTVTAPVFVAWLRVRKGSLCDCVENHSVSV